MNFVASLVDFESNGSTLFVAIFVNHTLSPYLPNESIIHAAQCLEDQSRHHYKYCTLILLSFHQDNQLPRLVAEDGEAFLESSLSSSPGRMLDDTAIQYPSTSQAPTNEWRISHDEQGYPHDASPHISRQSLILHSRCLRHQHATRRTSVPRKGFESSSSSTFLSNFAVLPDASSTTNSNTNTTSTSQPDLPSRQPSFLGLEIRRSKRKSNRSSIQVPPVACLPIPEWALQQRAGAIDKLTMARPQGTARMNRSQTANANLSVGKRDSLHVPVASGSRTTGPKSTHGYPASLLSSGWAPSPNGWGVAVPHVPPLPFFAPSFKFNHRRCGVTGGASRSTVAVRKTHLQPDTYIPKSSTSSYQSRAETSSQSYSLSSNSVGERGDHTPSPTRSSSAAPSYDEDSGLPPSLDHASRSPNITSSDITTIVEAEEEREGGGVSSMGVLSSTNPNSNSASEEEKGHVKRLSISSGLARMKSLRAKGAKPSGDMRKTAMPNKGSVVDLVMMPKGSVDLGVVRVSDESDQAGIGGVNRSAVVPGEETERVTLPIDVVPQPKFYTEERVRKAASVGDSWRHILLRVGSPLLLRMRHIHML
ncbi:hypothetical protein BDQ12DRAFT_729738 [Crucibulum laeve]|uniref:Uncharacterized protein n=1 Tax=Crucibulum laeve TaxID=68775 RepID=A0A5C3LES4_9AGAR|nr:hypothetical protein BDQ12DRAFT_729738 [Crucibulum laeve]